MNEGDVPAGAERGPGQALAQAISSALLPAFPAREETALHLAELLLDATESALALDRGGDAAQALAALELCATSADVFSWEGPPGWDVVLARGLASRRALAPGAAFLDGLGTAAGSSMGVAAAESARAGLRQRLVASARAEAGRFLIAGRAVAALPASAGPEAANTFSDDGAVALVQAHASLLRLIGHAALLPSLLLPESPHPGGIGVPSAQALRDEMDARAAAGSDFASAQEEWLGRLQAQNKSAAQPGFRTFFAGLSQTPRIALALRDVSDQARAGKLAPDCEALLGAVGGWQPVRWSSLRTGAPAVFLEELCPQAPQREAPLARLAREADAALDLAGRLWVARALSLAAFTTLAGLLTARCASLLALWEELGGK